MITYQREKVIDLWDEAMPLLKAHWREIARYQDIPLDIDQLTYEHAELAGILRCYTAREAGVLVGYAVFFVKPHPHYAGSLQAVQDVLYLIPDARGRYVGVGLIGWCDTQLRAEGVQVVYHHVKVDHDFSPILDHLGYELVETVWGRRLDHGSDRHVRDRTVRREEGQGRVDAHRAHDPESAHAERS